MQNKMVSNELVRTISLHELSLRIKRQYTKWLAISNCLMTCPERYNRVPIGTIQDSVFGIRGDNSMFKTLSKHCFGHSASLYWIAFPKNRRKSL